MSAAIGIALLDMPLTYTYSYGAAIGWFFVMVLLAVLASLGTGTQGSQADDSGSVGV